MKITIKVFAALKDHFEQEFSVEARKNDSVSSLIERLGTISPAARPILSKCRIAIQEQFVSPQYILKDEEHLCIIPPSSGG